MMTEVTRARRFLRWSCVVGVTAAILAAAGTASSQSAKPAPAPAKPAAAATPPTARANHQATALVELQKNLQRYLKLREELGKKLTPLSPTASSSELAARQEALAAALKAARKGARPGDLIPPRAARLIARTVKDDFRQRKPAATRAVFKEVPETLRPAINRTFPDDAALATIPPLLLNNLPILPDNLQYRFAQRDVVILDGDTRIIVDYVANVLPAH
jgi:hypothetical protein